MARLKVRLQQQDCTGKARVVMLILMFKQKILTPQTVNQDVVNQMHNLSNTRIPTTRSRARLFAFPGFR